jgi:hypothetical protein
MAIQSVFMQHKKVLQKLVQQFRMEGLKNPSRGLKEEMMTDVFQARVACLEACMGEGLLSESEAIALDRYWHVVDDLIADLSLISNLRSYNMVADESNRGGTQ